MSRAVVVLAMLAAGCVSPVAVPSSDDEDGLYRWFACSAAVVVEATAATTGRCNVRMTGAGLGPANEVTIAVDPTNPLRLVAGAKDYSLQADACGGEHDMWFATYWSDDGGFTWRSAVLPGPDLPATDRPRYTIAGYRCGSDPVVFWDGAGNAYYGGGAGRLVPGGPQSDGVVEVFVARSDDGGATYSRAASPARSQAVANFQDKYWFAADPASGTLYGTWESFVGPGAPGGTQIVFSRSVDGGATWTSPLPISDPTRATLKKFSMPQVASGGAVYVTWLEPADGSVWLARSTDGGAAWSKATQAFTIEGVIWGNLPPTGFRTFTMPVLGIDASGGERDGRLHLAWAAHNGDRGADVFLAWSDDAGATWSEPTVVNDDAGPADQLMPWLDVGPGGDVHVAFYDRRDDPANRHLHVYYAHVAEGKVAPNLRVSELLLNASLSYHQGGGEFLGDYIGVEEGSNGWVHVIWTDTRAGRAEAFTAALARAPGGALVSHDAPEPGTHVPTPGSARVRGSGLAQPEEHAFEGHLDVSYYCLPAGHEAVEGAVADRAGAFHEFDVPRDAAGVKATLAWDAGTPGRAAEDLELEVYDARGDLRAGSYADQPERVDVELYEGDSGTWTIAVYACTSVPTDYRVDVEVV